MESRSSNYRANFMTKKCKKINFSKKLSKNKDKLFNNLNLLKSFNPNMKNFCKEPSLKRIH